MSKIELLVIFQSLSSGTACYKMADLPSYIGDSAKGAAGHDRRDGSVSRSDFLIHGRRSYGGLPPRRRALEFPDGSPAVSQVQSDHGIRRWTCSLLRRANSYPA